MAMAFLTLEDSPMFKKQVGLYQLSPLLSPLIFYFVRTEARGQVRPGDRRVVLV